MSKRLLLLCLVTLSLAHAEPRQEFFMAVQQGQTAQADRLLEAHPDFLEAQLFDGLHPLFQASHLDRLEMVNLLLARGAKVNATTRRGSTALHAAANRGSETILALLLENGADPNIRNGRGQTPLVVAVNRRHLAVVAQLLAHHADPNLADQNGRTPLHQAAGMGQPRLVQMLVEAGAEVNPEDKQGHTPLGLARLLKNNSWGDVGGYLEGQGGLDH
ncbi:MAG: ankyrin repeat domain-containing protein [Candidatus Eremiobacteraeota bacterium]|nr:ankyrin repeat domain-containing protein [Candidatus Eremiobacteraeota bacterium]